MKETTPDWQPLGNPAPTELTDARLQVHWAVQLIAAAADSLLEHRADDRHTVTRWDHTRRVLIGQPLGAARVALRVANLDLLVLGEDGLLAQMMLNDRRLDEAQSWLTAALRSHMRRSDANLRLREQVLPEHPVGQGARFNSTDSLGFNELARWLANADRVLSRIAAGDDRASEPAVWPLDLVASSVIDLGDDRAVTVGLSLGDDAIAEPYFYVRPTPWPPGDRPELPGGGAWRTDDLSAAVLTGSQITADEDAGAQEQRVDRFVRAAIDAVI